MDETMKKRNEAEAFEHYRVLLFSIAYRMTGSASDAEDLVQETYLRYQASENSEIISLKAYLTTIVTRLALNYLQSAHVTREQYLGTWLPEPVLTSEDGGFPGAALEQQETLSLAFLRLLEALSPPERAVFLLHEIFDYPFSEIGMMLSKSPATCRQIFHRARQALQDKRARFESGAAATAPVAAQFSVRQSGREHGSDDQPAGSRCGLLVRWWRQCADQPQTDLRTASRGAFLAERDAQKSAASDRDAGRDQWQPGPLVLGRGQAGWSHQPVFERRGHSGDLCSAEPGEIGLSAKTAQKLQQDEVALSSEEVRVTILGILSM